jgi:hypothetical protein
MPPRSGSFENATAPVSHSPAVQIKVTLLELVPATWRRFRVPANFTLRRLHAVLQTVMGWSASPRHLFRTESERFGMPSGGSDDLKDSRWVTLQDLLAQNTRTLSYECHPDALWTHRISIESVTSENPGNPHPVCLEGARACPPEGCAGPDGYLDLLDDPTLDPDAFDLDAVNSALAALRF